MPCALNEHFWLRIRPLIFLNFLFICIKSRFFLLIRWPPLSGNPLRLPSLRHTNLNPFYIFQCSVFFLGLHEYQACYEVSGIGKPTPWQKEVSHHTKVDCDSKKQTKTHTQGEGESKCPIVAEWLRSLWSREENCASAIITPQILNQALKVLPI